VATETEHVRALHAAAKALDAAEKRVLAEREKRDRLVMAALNDRVSQRTIAVAIGKERGLVHMIRAARS
jgi:hypothetical protein